MFKKIIASVCAILCALAFVGCSSGLNKGEGMSDLYLPQAPSGEFGNDSFDKITEKDFVDTATAPSSSFRLSVSTSSYTYSRNCINNFSLPQADAVRIEDFVNYFDYNITAPQTDTFSAYSNVYDCPWSASSKLLRITVKAKQVKRQNTASNLVFLIDTSGSMTGRDRLDLIKVAFGYLTDCLGENDRVSVVTYAGSSKVLLSGESGASKTKIKDAINMLSSGGSTGGANGITTAYAIAKDNFIEGGNNRVILATDGDFNVGMTSNEDLTALIKTQSDSGIYFTGVGVGFGNYHDTTMQTLANSGNGQALYIDNQAEAKKVFTEGLTGTLFTVAKDAKAQVVFNADKVEKYRLLGYDNLALTQEEFENTNTDAGEVGSGHIVTAVYQIIPKAAVDDGFKDGRAMLAPTTNNNDGFKDGRAMLAPTTNNTDEYKVNKGVVDNFYAVAEIKYKDVITNEDKSVKTNVTAAAQTADDKFIACVLEGALLLRNSAFKGDANYASVISRLENLAVTDPYKIEFYNLMLQASDLITK